MKEMKDGYLDAYNYMNKIPVCHWSRHAFDRHVKSDHVTNNISECFNSWIDKFKGKPALTLLEELQRSFMNRIYKRHEEAKKWKTEIPPEVLTKLTENQDARRYMQVMFASDQEYEMKEGMLPLDMKNLSGRPKKNRKRGADEEAKYKRSSGAKCGAYKNKASGTVLGKRKIYVGSSSNINQKKKKTYPLLSSQTPSQILVSSQPLSQNAPISQPTVGSAVPGNF
ncbi:hypothetical protein ACOSQ2_031408 [Xanthoceras sorbifolium]